MHDSADPWNQDGPADWPTSDDLRAASIERLLEQDRQQIEQILDGMPRPVAALIRWWAKRKAARP